MNLKLLIFFKIFAIGILSLIISNAHLCIHHVSRYNTTFDLSPLTITSNDQQSLPYYHVYDSFNTTDRNFSYVFNICAKPLKIPDKCSTSTHKTCNAYNDSGCTTYSNINSSYAYQIQKKCNYLSNNYGGPMEFSLLDNTDPSQGVVLTYKNGEYCGNTIRRNRELNLRFECENDAYNIFDYETVTESQCSYNVTIKSIYGCPTQCGTYGSQLCNSKGLCSYDFTSMVPKCFCYYRYSGTSCQLYSSSEAKIKQPKKEPPTSQYVHTLPYEQNNTIIDVTYDFSDFHLNSGFYTVNDSLFEEKYMQYYFNIFGNINSSLPDKCDNKFNGSVYQYNTNNGNCYLAGTASNYTLQFLDSLNPTKGTVLTYTAGEICTATGKPRQFTINFQCPTTARSYYDVNKALEFTDLVEEYDDRKCAYYMTWITPLACPYQCITTTVKNNEKNFSVCSGRGICAADTEANFVRCLCDDGYTGDYCAEIQKPYTSSSDDNSGFTIAIIVICIALVISIGVVIFLYYRNKTLRELTTHLMKTGEYEDGVPETLIAEPIARLPNHESESESESEEEQNNKNDNKNDNKNNDDNNGDSNKGQKDENEMVEITTDTLQNKGNDNTNNTMLPPPTNSAF